jgi:hypothetical protein
MKKMKKKSNIFLKISFLIKNIIVLVINLYFLLFVNINKTNDNEFAIFKIIKEFKNSDYFPMFLTTKTYKYISNFLNDKYNTKKGEESKLNKKKRKIVLNSVDLNDPNYHRKWLRRILNKKYRIKFDSNNPDYVIYNVFGTEHLNDKYNNSVKIAIFTENKIPDLNEADYVIGHSHINYLDRCFKFSIFLWIINDFKNIREKVLKSPIRTKFCAAVITNDKTPDDFRIKFINELEKYKLIDMGGKYKNNIGGPVKNKKQFLTSYKFSISIENSEGDGYLTEKIVDSFYSGTIPIFYGDYLLDEYINPKTYILIKGEKDIKEKIEYIKKIDNDDKLYRNILKENVLIDNNITIKIEKEEREFLYHIFDQDKRKAFRKKD